MNYLVSFERIGRRRDVPMLRVVVDDALAHAQQIAEAVHKYAGKFLGSSEYEVDVDLTAENGDGSGVIGWGRFGKFVVAAECQAEYIAEAAAYTPCPHCEAESARAAAETGGAA